MTHEEWVAKIQSDIQTHDLMVYMRGTPEVPNCGFSARVVRVLKELNHPFGHENMDQDNRSLWNSLALINDWRTSPQIYVKGEFIGGCDIFCDMFKSGELQKKLGLAT